MASILFNYVLQIHYTDVFLFNHFFVKHSIMRIRLFISTNCAKSLIALYILLLV